MKGRGNFHSFLFEYTAASVFPVQNCVLCASPLASAHHEDSPEPGPVGHLCTHALWGQRTCTTHINMYTRACTT